MIIFWKLLLCFSLLFVVMASIFMKFFKPSDSQKRAGMMLGHEAWWKAPGKKLEVKETGKGGTDIIISADFLNKDDKSKLDTCKYLSLRKSIECTLHDQLTKGPYGAKILADNDRDKPRYLLHGWSTAYSPDNEGGEEPELWTTHARTTTWAAIYSWAARLPFEGWTDWNQQIDLTTAPEVLGYAYLFEISNPDFYKQERIIKKGGLTYECPKHTPETEGKIFARFDYRRVKYMGDFPKGDPDAYIFRGAKVFKDANLKELHEYRIMKP